MYHKPVLIKPTIQMLSIKEGGVYCDLTLGDGGYTKKILEHSKNTKVYGFDKDKYQIQRAKKRLSRFKDRVKYINADFANFRSDLALFKVAKVDGILLDLGVSTRQISKASLGFSYMKDGPLDMRMDQTNPLTAKQIIADYPLPILVGMLKKYGQEPKARRVAVQIVKARQISPIKTTFDLNRCIEKVSKDIKTKARVYQAIRITVNGELESLQRVLKEAPYALKPKARILAISYHSGEDRIVKHTFRFAQKTCICPPEFPKCVCNKQKTLTLLTKKPIKPSIYEIETNPKARSAKLRVAQKETK